VAWEASWWDFFFGLPDNRRYFFVAHLTTVKRRQLLHDVVGMSLPKDCNISLRISKLAQRINIPQKNIKLQWMENNIP
jgi:hypothetical protein